MTIPSDYPQFQLAKALRASATADQKGQKRAKSKAQKWQKVLQGMASGLLNIGSRTPVKNTPPWITLEVLTGGFATGQYKASGPLTPYEQKRCHELDIPTEQTALSRLSLNQYFLSDAGLAELNQFLNAGTYQIATPEEGALLVLATLLQQQEVALAEALLQELAPWMDQLRFFPEPTRIPVSLEPKLALKTLGEVKTQIAPITSSDNYLAQVENIRVWAPLYDELARLLLATRQTSVPGERYPTGWQAQAKDWLSRYQKISSNAPRSRRYLKPKGNFVQLKTALETCLLNPDAVTPERQARWLVLLQRYEAKWGKPGSDIQQAKRVPQDWQIQGPDHSQIAQELCERIEEHPQDEGLEDLSGILEPIAYDGGSKPLHRVFTLKLKRALEATPEILLTEKVIRSGETLAEIYPEISGGIQAQSRFASTERQRLYTALYQAFRHRRSLLLLNYETQVQFQELPWVQALLLLSDRQNHSLDAAKELARLYIQHFPETQLPNPMVQELKALTPGQTWPWIEELAADIFMGGFSAKFAQAMDLAARHLQHSLYARYYGIDYSHWLSIPQNKKSQTLESWCRQRSGADAHEWSTASNGSIIEQAQILTTHNLVNVFYELGLDTQMSPTEIQATLYDCWHFVAERLQLNTPDRHAQLVHRKRSAYAWRHLVFYLGLLDAAPQSESLSWLKAGLHLQGPAFQETMGPYLEALQTAAQGKTPDTKPFVGWVVK